MNAAEIFARHALSAEPLLNSAQVAAKTFILDTIGVGVAGARAPYADAVLAAARGWGGPSVGRACIILGRGDRLPPPSAAFVNGYQIHCQEFDCVHEAAVVHPMATIFAALSAECGVQRISGLAIMEAVSRAVDVAAGLGVAAQAPIKFFRPSTAGVFGATLGLARLRGFGIGMAVDALGYALAQASGTMQAHVEGKPALPVQIGNAARAAQAAADLASAGVPGPAASIDGPFGYLPLFEGDFALEPVLDALASRPRIAEVSHKPFPTGRAAHGGIAAALQLRRRGVEPASVDSLTLFGPPLIKRLVGRPYQEEMSVNYARLCFAYLGAVALLRGVVGLDDFEAVRLCDQDVAALAQRISVVDDGSSNPAAFAPQIARAVLKSGDVVEVRVDQLPGSPEAPLSREAHLDKFRRCMAFGGYEARAEEMIQRVDAIEEETDVGALLALAAGERK